MAIMQRVETVFTGLAGTPWYNRLYFDEEGGSDQDRVDHVGEFWDNLASLITDAISWEVQDDVAFIDDATGDTVDVMTADGPTGQGTNTGGILPLATQGLLRMRTGVFVAGRQITGKVFVPGMCIGNGAEGRPLLATRQQIEAAAAELNSHNGGWLVYSPTRARSAEILTWSAWTEWAVLRSRRD